MMRVQNKETLKTLKRILFKLGMVVCLFLTGCRDKSTDSNNRALAYAKKGQYDLAISDYNKALEINPRYAGASRRYTLKHFRRD